MKLAMVFPGQGSQAVGMLNAYAGLPEIDAVRAQTASALGADFLVLLDEGPADALGLTVNTQPAMVAVAYGAQRASRFAASGTARRVAGAVLVGSAALTLLAPQLVAAAPWLHPWIDYLCR